MSTDLNFLLKRGVSEIISEEELVKLLNSGKKLRLKEGFDPSSAMLPVCYNRALSALTASR